MSYRPHGKYTRIDPSNPTARGVCDYTGFWFNRTDLVRQMEWRGNSLEWTGFYVGRPFLDVPNEQNRPPILPPDPVPIKEPRTLKYQTITWSNNSLPAWNLVQYTFDSLWSNEDGTQALPYAQNLQSLQNYYWSP